MENKLIYEGKAKKIFTTKNPDEILVYYKDDATAGNGAKKGTILNKGILNNKITNFFFDLLAAENIPHHLVKVLSDREIIAKKLEIIPLEVIIRNVAAGSLAKRLGVPEGMKLKLPVIEYCYKCDDLGDPMVNNYHILAMEWATQEELRKIEELSLRINEIMIKYLATKNIDLIDFKLEFGRDKNGEVILADEISPDNCRFWDSQSQEKLDKDRFRRDLGDVEAAYKEVLFRLTGNKI